MRRSRYVLSVALCAVLTLFSPVAFAVSADARETHTRAPAQPLGFDLDGATIPDLQQRMRAGTLSAASLVSAYLARIHTVDRLVRAVIALDSTATRQAAESDARRRAGQARGPLEGMPVLIKDNVHTAGLPTTAGSRAMRGSPPANDATLVARLRAAGAIILGKANLSEWANFRAERPTSGWSGVGGQTHNPYVLDRNPCGSSSGSAAGVAASLAQVAIGTETDGSVVCPAGMTGVVGHKPTLGMVSRSGVAPISAEQDTPGPIARHVVDAALTLSAMRGPDPDDPATTGDRVGQTDDYGVVARAEGVRGKRVGLWRLPALGPEVDAVMTQSVDILREHGAEVVPVRMPYQDRIAELEFPALLTEFHRDIDEYLRSRSVGPDELAALIEYNRNDPLEQTCFAGQELFEQALASPPPDDPEYQTMRAELTDLAQRSIDETLVEHDLDVIAAPTNPPAWLTDCERGDDDVMPASTPAAVAGYPSTTVPAGSVGELPIGMLLMAGRWTDARLLDIAGSFERASQVRIPPRYLQTVDVGPPWK